MSQYSETIGSFTRTGNYPLEANYIFSNEDSLKQFYSDPLQLATLHEGLLKVVQSSPNGKQALYWVVNRDNKLEFNILIEDLQLDNINIQLQTLLDDIKNIIGTETTENLPEDLDNLLNIANAIKTLQQQLTITDNNLKAAVGTTQDDIQAYLKSLAYKSITELSNALHTFLQTTDDQNTSINTWAELQQFLNGFTNGQTLQDILATAISNILGDPNPSSQFSTLRSIEDFTRTLQSTLVANINNLQTELNQTQEGVGLDQNGNYDPDYQTHYLSGATSVMSALRTLDNIIFNIGEVADLYTPMGSVKDLDELKSLESVTKGHVYNVESDIILSGEHYPANTNFVYISDQDNQAHIESNWDSLGGVLDLSNYFTKDEILELIPQLVSINGAKIEGNDSNLEIQDKIIIIPKATSSKDGVIAREDKLFIDGIREGNLELPVPTITGTWTFYNNSNTPIDRTSISPVPDINNPIIEQGYKASFSGTYKWVHQDGKKDPTQVQSGSNWSDLPTSGINSEVYTSPNLTSNTTIRIGIQAGKTGLMVSGSNVIPATGMDTTSASRTITFQTRIYYGTALSNNVTEELVESLSGNILGGRARTLSGVTATTSQYYIYAYPQSLGKLTTIIQDGATPVLGAFTLVESLNITNAAGLTIPMFVYISNNLGAFTNNTLRFE